MIFGCRADEARLALIEPFLYHPENSIRGYAAGGLSYWPAERIARFVTDVMRRRGPNTLFLQLMGHSARSLNALLPYLRSNNAVLLHGAVEGVAQMIRPTTPAEVLQRATDAYLAAADHVLHAGDSNTINTYINRLPLLDGAKARPMLWSLVERGKSSVALNGITLFKNPDDLPRIQAYLQAPSANDSDYVTLFLRERYGDAAISVPGNGAAKIHSR